jgi:hypothetical protein
MPKSHNESGMNRLPLILAALALAASFGCAPEPEAAPEATPETGTETSSSAPAPTDAVAGQLVSADLVVDGMT